MTRGQRNYPILHVTDLPCPEGRGENHRLVNTRAGTTTCAYCKRTWADLDADLRKLREPEEPS